MTSRYIEAAHRMFRSNAKTLEGSILYTSASQPLASLDLTLMGTPTFANSCGTSEIGRAHV